MAACGAISLYIRRSPNGPSTFSWSREAVDHAGFYRVGRGSTYRVNSSEKVGSWSARNKAQERLWTIEHAVVLSWTVSKAKYRKNGRERGA